jgi:murein DD-endopeptidase MepM/ murein hydrolase activator NlpD
VSRGIVVSIKNGWTPAQTNLRGGNYVWVFDPAKQEYLYYAHLQDVKVCVGQLVAEGQALGNVGRTGLNAYKRKSITHLHFSVIQYSNALMRPRNPFDQLYAAGKENARRKDVMNARLSKRSGIAQR